MKLKKKTKGKQQNMKRKEKIENQACTSRKVFRES
jgi:hypothetical protein